MHSKTLIITELKQLLDTMDPNDIYRSIYDHENNLLVKGSFPVQQRLVDDYCKVDFTGKTVVDLGCNFGFFSFIAAQKGASHITALDYLPEIVKGATLLASLYGHDNVTFKTFDIESPDKNLGNYDVAMLVDFFGKSNIRKQKIKSLLEFLQTLSDSELLMAFRPINRIEKDLKMSLDDFLKLYPAEYVRDGAFILMDYVRDILADKWEMTAVSEYDGHFSKDKFLFHCQRK